MVIAALFLALVAYQIYASNRTAHAAAATNAQNLTLILESKLNTDFAAAERKVSAMITEIEADAMRMESAGRFRPQISRWLKSNVGDILSASALHYFDANGDLLYSSIDGARSANIADRPHFRRIKADPISATTISDVNLGRTTGRVSIHVTKPVLDQGGVFLGTAAATIDLNAIYEHFRNLELGKNGVVALRRLDNGASVVRFPGPLKVDNQPTPDLPVRKAILSNGPAGFMDIVSRVDGRQRIYGYRRIGAFPLFIAVGVADSDFLAEWRRDSVFLLVGSLLFLGILGTVFFWLAAAESHRRKSEIELRDSENRFRHLTEISTDWYWEQDESYRFTYMSPGFSQLFGVEESVLGKARWEALHFDTDPQMMRAQDALLAARKPFKDVVISRMGPDNTMRYVQISGQPVFDAQGRFAGYRGVGKDITEHKQMEDRVRQLAFHDALTQLPNRRLLNDRLGQTMAANKRSGCYGAVMFLDLDNFKLLNDRHGHAVGDLLLIEAASRLKSCVREMDTVARFGGDEFVVMISELGADKSESTTQAGVIAEKIRAAMAAPYVLTIEHGGKEETMVEHRCTASIGVALFSKHDTRQDDILTWADTAMYRAKEAGCNLIRFYDQKA